MKRLALLLLLAIGFVPAAFAQETDHLQVGVYADYFGLKQTKTNFAGLGARVAIPAIRNVNLEGEMTYDFDQTFTEGFTNSGTGAVFVQPTGHRLLSGLFGPKINFGGRRGITPFITLKGGFLDFMFDQRPATISTFVSTVDNLRASNVNGVFSPGGGFEGKLGPWVCASISRTKCISTAALTAICASRLDRSSISDQPLANKTIPGLERLRRVSAPSPFSWS